MLIERQQRIRELKKKILKLESSKKAREAAMDTRIGPRCGWLSTGTLAAYRGEINYLSKRIATLRKELLDLSRMPGTKPEVSPARAKRQAPNGHGP